MNEAPSGLSGRKPISFRFFAWNISSQKRGLALGLADQYIFGLIESKIKIKHEMLERD